MRRQIAGEYVVDQKYFDLASESDLAFILAEAKESIKDIDDGIKSIRDKSAIIFQICVVALFGIIGFVVSERNTSCLYWIAVGNALILFIVVNILVKNLSVLAVSNMGTPPSALFNERIFYENSDNDAIRQLHFSVIQGLERDITANKEVMESNARRHTRAVNMLLIQLGASLATALLSDHLPFLLCP